MKILFKIFLAASFFLSFITACTDLEEKLYSEILQDDFFKTQEEVVSAIAPVYGSLRGFTNDTWQLGTHSTDESLTPEKALGHWYGENWPQINSHKWTPQNVRFNNAWNYNFNLVNPANKLLFQLESVQTMDEALKHLLTAELKILRGFGYYNLIDLFGNVPLITNWNIEDGIPLTTPRTEVFNFIVNDIESNVEFLSEQVNASTYGRFNKFAAYALLAKFYLNAETWTGTSHWDKVIEYCDKIIDSEKYSLEDNYYNNFIINNENSKENIFVIPYDEIYTRWGNTIHMRALHYAQRAQFNLQSTPWNGFTAIPSFIHSFDSTDIRLNGWLIGQQYSSTGEILYCNQESSGKPLILTTDYENIFDPSDNTQYSATYALEFMGARFAKFEYWGFRAWAENDFPIYRYADILLMKAEALMRQNGGNATSEAVNLVNLVRDRAFNDPLKLYTVETLTLDTLLAERGWEFYCEGFRRNDLVRFDKFIKGTWEFYDRSWEDETRNIFPIPQPQINANPNLTQNPGY